MQKSTGYLTLFIMVLVVSLGIPAMHVSATETSSVATVAETVCTGTLGTNNGVQWSYDESTKTLTITGEDSGLGSSTASPFKSICSDVETIIVKDCKLSGSAASLFRNLTDLKTITFENFDTTNVTDMSSIFQACSSLTDLDVSGFATSNVTSMSYMFSSCESLTDLDVSGFATSNVTSMSCMFSGCESLTDLDVSGFVTSNVKYMHTMFSGCSSLIDLDVSGFNTSNVVGMNSMFYGCSSLVDLDVSGFDTSKVVGMYRMFEGCSSLTGLDVSGFDTSNVKDMEYMFYGCKSLTGLDVSGFATSKVTDMEYMFYGCKSLTGLDVSGFDTSNVKDMECMFEGCSSLTGLDVSGFDTSKLTGMSSMFSGCSSLTILDVSGFDTSNVEDMSSMFDGCSSLTVLDVSGFDTSNVEYMSSMFEGCSSLTGLDVTGFDTSNVVTMRSMFQGCSSLTDLDVSGFDTSNVVGMGFMFSSCSSLTDLDVSGFDTSKVTDMSSMFHWCKNLTDLDVSGFNTSKVTGMNTMFSGCSGLTDLDVSGFDTSKVTNMWRMFYKCNSLTDLDVSGFDTSKAASVYCMFYDCSSLTVLDISGFDISNVTNLADMLNGCSALKFLYTPAVMGEDQTISLPVTLINAKGEACSEITLDTCKMLLTKEGEKQNIKILADATELIAGDSLQLTLEVDNTVKKAAINKYFDWSSTALGTATVSADGLVTAVGAGSTTIQVTVPGRSDLTAQLTVNVKDKVTLNTVEISDWTVGQEGNFTAYVNGQAVAADSMSWSSSNPEVATCVNGKLVGISAGTTTISCTKENGTVATCKVTVIRQDVVTLNATEINGWTIGLKGRFAAYVNGKWVDPATMTWSSSNPEVATCEGGNIVGVGAGTTVISCTKENGTVATCKVTVKAQDIVTLNATEIGGWTVGLKGRFAAYVNGKWVDPATMTWSSSNPEVATCEGGNIVGVGAGTTIISCTKENGTVATCKVTVQDIVTLNATEIGGWTVGLKGRFAAYVNGKWVDPATMTWSSSNPEVATCEGGNIVGVGAGTTVISCTKENGTVATCKVTVSK